MGRNCFIKMIQFSSVSSFQSAVGKSVSRVSEGRLVWVFLLISVKFQAPASAVVH